MMLELELRKGWHCPVLSPQSVHGPGAGGQIKARAPRAQWGRNKQTENEEQRGLVKGQISLP